MQTIDIAQGGSDNRARCPGKTRSKQAEILTGISRRPFPRSRMAAPPNLQKQRQAMRQ